MISETLTTPLSTPRNRSERGWGLLRRLEPYSAPRGPHSWDWAQLGCGLRFGNPPPVPPTFGSMCILTAPFPGKSEFTEETVLRPASPTPTHQRPSQRLSHYSMGQGAHGLGLVPSGEGQGGWS